MLRDQNRQGNKDCQRGAGRGPGRSRYKGRAPTARVKAGEIRKPAAEGVGRPEIARRLGVGERPIYRTLAALV
jgi:DNA invertase Pin-like site-specific DNA recombinase